MGRQNLEDQMFGSGLIKGLGVTFRHIVKSYVDDFKRVPKRYEGGREFLKQGPDEEGIYTIQYPEEKRQLPERFRFLPMLIADRCTACGICAKACPPQCIWIERAQDEAGKNLRKPAKWILDASICMGCGMCAEFCTFDAIAMSKDYERAFRERGDLIFDLDYLTVSESHYAETNPTRWAEEQAKKAAK
jgi:NADH-quinone oxidoreductase subunit I